MSAHESGLQHLQCFVGKNGDSLCSAYGAV